MKIAICALLASILLAGCALQQIDNCVRTECYGAKKPAP